jgi:hypothetical protein
MRHLLNFDFLKFVNFSYSLLSDNEPPANGVRHSSIFSSFEFFSFQLWTSSTAFHCSRYQTKEIQTGRHTHVKSCNSFLDDEPFWENSWNMILTSRMKMAVVWVVAPCSLVEVHRRFRGTCCLHYHSLPWWWRQQVLLKRRWTSTGLHGATTQKTAIKVIFILAAVRTWNPTYELHVSQWLSWNNMRKKVSSAVTL